MVIKTSDGTVITPQQEGETSNETETLDVRFPPSNAKKVVDEGLKTLGISDGIKGVVDLETAKVWASEGDGSEALTNLKRKVDKTVKDKNKALDKFKKSEEAVADLSQKLQDMKMDNTLSFLKAQTVKADKADSIPSGKVVLEKISSIFGWTGLTELEDIEVPRWKWDGVHPDVPEVDPNYIFRKEEVSRVIYSILTNSRMYLHGHTGTGKTTLLEQVAAKLNWPFLVINFDSEITRMDLIGRDTLTTDSKGKTVSSFVDGILPRAMSGPYIACFDEIDFVRPDVAYVMQRALEGNYLRITEDGGRIVSPDPMFRMFATGNTVGQGDEHGMYQGARPQSLALLDRFTVWMEVNYINEEQKTKLIKDKFPTLTRQTISKIVQYSEEHISAFLSANVLQPLSPRGILSISAATDYYTATGVSSTDAINKAIRQTVIDRASSDDKVTLSELLQRVV